MATNFPGSLDSFSNPSSSSTLDSPSHAAQHANINDAMEAVQTKLGVGAHTIGEGQTWTPQVTQGATSFTETVNYAKYWEINDLIIAQAFLTISSGTGGAGNGVQMTLPIAADAAGGQVVGSVWIFDSSTATGYGGQTIVIYSTTTVAFVGDWAGGVIWGASPSIGLTVSDQIRMNVMYMRG